MQMQLVYFGCSCKFQVLILVLSAVAIAVHVLAFVLPILFMHHLNDDEKMHFVRTMLYLKNQLFALALLFSFVEFLDFLTVHHLFGPWAIIIRDLMYDLLRYDLYNFRTFIFYYRSSH